MKRWSWAVRFNLRKNTRLWGSRKRRWPKRTLEVEALEDRTLLSTFTVTNTNDSGAGSLRQAILDSNSNPGQNTIQFQIATSGVQTIAPLSALPDITHSVIIDGTTEGGYDPTNPKPLIELNGTNAGSSVFGLYIAAPQCTVRALIINRFTQSGIALSIFGGSTDTVQGCYLGTTPDGSAAAPNSGWGIAVTCSNNIVGGTTAGTGNLISGNGLGGVSVYGNSAKGNLVEGNRIGTTADGSAALPNGGSGGAGAGVWIQAGAINNTIGGTAAGAGNVISGSAWPSSGVVIGGAGTSGNLVEGNLIGTNAAGTAAIANGQYGVFFLGGASNNTVGGTAAGADNLISGNASHGIYFQDSGTTGNIIEGNRIGTTADGSAALPNRDGIWTDSFAAGNTFGGSVAGAGNLISGNTDFGILIESNSNIIQGNLLGTNAAGTGTLPNWEGVILDGNSNTVGGTTAGASNTISGNKTIGVDIGASNNNLVEGNRIGTTADGSTALANGTVGIAVGNSAVNNTIGGTTAASANLISGNTRSGVDITDSGTTGNLVEGNDIGTDVTGTAAIPNGQSGVFIHNSASGNTVGGTAAGAGNIIAYNGGVGVDVQSGTGNAILGNAIYANWVLGIDLGDDGVTPNDSLGHTGPNNYQNFPVLSPGSSPSMVTGSLHGAASTTFRVEFFASASADPTGYGQGQTLVGFQNVTTDATGQATFSASLSLPAGEQIISATATDAGNNTSEFSQALNAPVPPVSIAATNNYGKGYAALGFGQSGGYVPPDTCGAAGPTNYVETVNQTVALYSPKATRATATTSSLSNFWVTAGGLARADSGSKLTDPAVIYNDQIGRFIVGDLDVDFTTHVSTFDIAVSKTSTPSTLTSADWNFYQIVTTESGFDADYPGNFGYNHDAFVLTLNMFGVSGGGHCQVVSVNNADLANGVAQASLHVYKNDLNDFSDRPTVMHDSVAGDPMWLITEHGDNKSIDVIKMSGVLSNTATFASTNLVVTPYSPVVNPLNPNGTVITNNIDSRIDKAAEWNNLLVATHSVSVSATEDDAQWYAIDLSGATPTLKDQGRVGAGNNTYVTYPSIDINASGQIGMTYMRSGNDTAVDYLSMYVTGRNSSDPAGTMEASFRVPAGIGRANYHDFTSGGRAGDLSGINVDPSDGSFWASNEFATIYSTNNWSTAVANFTITSTVSTTHFSVTPSVSSTTAGSAFSVTVSALNASNAVDATYRGTIHFKSSDTHAGVALPADYTFVAADNGVHTFTNDVTLVSAGNQSVTATDTQSGTITGSATVTVNPAAASSLVLYGFPSPVISGQAQNFSVQALDPYGNTATGYTGTVHFTSTDGAAALPANYTFTAGDAGVHSFSGTLETAGTQSLTATDAATASITGTETNILVKPASFLISGFPSPTTAGVAHSFSVTAENGNGTTATGYTGTVHFTSTDGQALLPADYPFTVADAGVHMFSATLKTAGMQSVTATDSAVTSVTGTQSGITVNAAALSKLAMTGFPSPTVAGVSHSFTVTAQDAYGNTITNYLGTVKFSSTDKHAILPATYTFMSGDAGSHSFSATLKTAGTQTITAKDTVKSTVTGSESVVVNPAAASHLKISAPATSTAGAAFSITVTALDLYGNIATGYTGTVHFTSSDKKAVLPADYIFNGGDAGVHVFSNAVTLKTAGSQSVTATDTMTATITGKSTIKVSAAAVDHLKITAPTSSTAGTAFSITVTVQDAYNNTVSTYLGTIHFKSSDSQAMLPADYTFTSTDKGVHTFSNGVTLKTTGTQTVTATDTVTATVTGTATITVKAPLASPLKFSGSSSVILPINKTRASFLPGRIWADLSLEAIIDLASGEPWLGKRS